LRNVSHAGSPASPKWIERLTHESVASRPVEQARHSAFIVTRLMLAASVLASAPVWTFLHGAPSLREAALFALSLTPLLAVAVLARTGALRIAQTISIFGWLSLAVAVRATTQGYDAVSLMLMTIALLESGLTLDIGLAAAVAVAAIVLLSLDALAQDETVQALQPLRATDILICATPLLFYVAMLSIHSLNAEKTRERADKRHTRDMRLLTDAIGDMVIHLDRTGAVSSIVGNAHKAYGLEQRDLIGRGFFQRVHVADRPAFLKMLSDAIVDETSTHALLRLQVAASPNDSGLYVEPVFHYFDARACAVVVRTDGEVAANDPVVCILRDVTAARRVEEEMAVAHAERERATASKSRFLANVSHELRTPLNAIIGFSEMLANEELVPTSPEKRYEYAQIISGSGHHLLEVVNTILDMSKIEVGSMQIYPEPFVLPALLDSCCDMMQLKADQSGVALARKYASQMEEIVGDKRACKQIILNLLSNAVKFTPAGGQVTARARPEGNFLAVTISDTGVGISAQDLARLGDPFFQANASLDRAYEGTGLGLSVVRGLVGLHGGSIVVESGLKSGTCVTVRLPLDCRQAQETANGAAKIEVIARHAAPAPANELVLEQEAVKKIA